MKMSDIEKRIRGIKNKGYLFFICDEDENIISKGFKNRVLAKKFIPVIRFSSYEKLKIIKMEVKKDGDGRNKNDRDNKKTVL